jgi:hypothetical protein
MVLRFRPADNTLRALALLLNGVVQYLFPALILINAIVWIAGITPHTPFFQPSAGNLVSVGLFAYLIGHAYMSYRRGIKRPHSG